MFASVDGGLGVRVVGLAGGVRGGSFNAGSGIGCGGASSVLRDVECDGGECDWECECDDDDDGGEDGDADGDAAGETGGPAGKLSAAGGGCTGRGRMGIGGGFGDMSNGHMAGRARSDELAAGRRTASAAVQDTDATVESVGMAWLFPSWQALRTPAFGIVDGTVEGGCQ